MIEIGPLRRDDRDAWEVLARGYKEFYRDPIPDEAYSRAATAIVAAGPARGRGRP
jgi:hypothetical protein